MNKIILIILVIIAVGLGYLLGKKHSPKMANDINEGSLANGEKGLTLIERQALEKKRNLEAIMGLMEPSDGAQGKESRTMTNNYVEQMLGIPESTVTRYFDELEKAGKIRQVGKTGQSVSYEKI